MQDLEPIIAKWGALVLGGALLTVAALVNRFAPHRRSRIRYALLLYVLYLVTWTLALAMRHTSLPTAHDWAEHLKLAVELLGAFTLVNLVALTTFDVFLPLLRLSPVALTGDLIVGLAYLVATFGVLNAAGVSASSVVTTSAVVSGVLALSLQATLGNILGGVALQLDGSVHVGDWLQLPDGKQGKVLAIRWRHTVVETRDWETIVVPNANLLAQNIIILGKREGRPVQYRKWVFFNVDFRYPPSRVIDVVREALWSAPIEAVADDPKPSIICYDFAKDGRDSFGYYAVRYWLTDLPNDDPTNSRIRTRIYSALKRAGIPLARPVQTLFMRPEENEEAEAARHRARKARAMATIGLFQSLTPDERTTLADHLRYAPFVAGETCTKQGAVAHWLYVLTAGTVEIRRRREHGSLTKTLATLEAPAVFGEMGVMTGEPRSADVVAITDVECYRLDKPGLKKILEARPEIAQAFSKSTALRRVELSAAQEHLDEQAQQDRLASEETRILDRMQEFFGLERTTRI